MNFRWSIQSQEHPELGGSGGIHVPYVDNPDHTINRAARLGLPRSVGTGPVFPIGLHSRGINLLGWVCMQPHSILCHHQILNNVCLPKSLFTYYRSASISTGFTVPLVEVSIGNGRAPKTTSKGVEFANVTLGGNMELGAKLSVTLAPQLGMRLKTLDGLVDATISMTPSSKLTASGDLNFKPTTGKITDPCVRLNNNLALDWGISGNAASWDRAHTGEIWSVDKKLWEKVGSANPCFRVASRTVLI